MEELNLITNKIFRYPALYRVTALFSVLLLGLIVLASLIAAIEAMRTGHSGAPLHIIILLTGVLLILWGMDFATRSITPTPDGLRVRWFLRRSVVPWPDVLGWRYLPLSLIHIRARKGAGIFVWPLLENYTDLLNEIDTQRCSRLRDEVLTK